jgi:hypothetical protein
MLVGGCVSDQISDGFKANERDAYHDLDLLSWTGNNVVSAPGTETRTIVIVIGVATIPPLAT